MDYLLGVVDAERASLALSLSRPPEDRVSNLQRKKATIWPWASHLRGFQASSSTGVNSQPTDLNRSIRVGYSAGVAWNTK